MDSLLLAVGGLYFLALIGFLYWWHELRKMERSKKQMPPRDPSA